MTTWVIGDIHGCAEELGELVERIAPGADDRIVSVGDLFHRGPDPAGVMDVLRAARARFVLGNHERRVLARFGLAPARSDGADRAPRREDFPALTESDLAGDGNRACGVAPERRAEVVRFLQEHDGYFLEQAALESAGPTPDGRAWCVVHAGLVPGRAPRDLDPEDLVSLRRLEARGRPYWYEVYQGPNLVLFGHTPASIPRVRRANGRLVALGLDTGCVYGGKLTAYSPELDELRQVAAKRAYARL
jgi:hypothetical protein